MKQLILIALLIFIALPALGSELSECTDTAASTGCRVANFSQECSNIGRTSAEIQCLYEDETYGPYWWTTGYCNLSCGQHNPVDARIKPPRNQSCRSGSIINPEDGILGETIPLVGTDETLNYRSDQAAMIGANYNIKIPITESTVDPDIASIEVTVSIAGQVHVFNYTTLTPNMTKTFVWDGKDNFGNYQRLAMIAKVKVVTEYSDPNLPKLTFEFNSNELGSFRAISLGLGGWTISGVNHYQDGVLPRTYLGTGEVIDSFGQYFTYVNGNVSIHQLSEIFKGYYGSVQEYVSGHELAKDRFEFNFSVEKYISDFSERIFGWIERSGSGSFSGIDSSRKFIRQIISESDFESKKGVVTFLRRILDGFIDGEKNLSLVEAIEKRLKKGKRVDEFYDFLFSLDYLRPKYVLKWGDKELNQLSPGQKGLLLLSFYLIVDKNDVPLIIDQPEENLDNQTVFDMLVPFIKEAKNRRQIIIVTHNPNLAVVCDAEQVIWSDLDVRNNYKISYVSGAIENPVINRKLVDILEGTYPAFNKRGRKYFG